jgi:hypothetical protein
LLRTLRAVERDRAGRVMIEWINVNASARVHGIEDRSFERNERCCGTLSMLETIAKSRRR